LQDKSDERALVSKAVGHCYDLWDGRSNSEEIMRDKLIGILEHWVNSSLLSLMSIESYFMFSSDDKGNWHARPYVKAWLSKQETLKSTSSRAPSSSVFGATHQNQRTKAVETRWTGLYSVNEAIVNRYKYM